MKNLLIATILIALATYSIAQSKSHEEMNKDARQWHLMGKTKVNFQRDNDEIIVLESKLYANVKLRIIEAPIDLTSIRIYFNIAGVQDMQIDTIIRSSCESQIIELMGGERNIRKIVFEYKTVNNNKDARGHVELWGYKTKGKKL